MERILFKAYFDKSRTLFYQSKFFFSNFNSEIKKKYIYIDFVINLPII